MKIDKTLRNGKSLLLNYFRGRANEILSEMEITYSAADFKKKSSAVNKAIGKSRDNLLELLVSNAKNENWANEELLECVLMITYTSDVVMLETRNSVWKYDYMSFSRRVGELWEPFCKLCFQYPIRNIKMFIPPLFSEVKSNLTSEIEDYIASLRLTHKEKMQLLKYYNKVWGLVTSGEIQLECDLHFIDGDTKYVVDFKSGFGSNEKGNTNRLLLVGSIYDNIEQEKYKCLIFVRSTDNNHYLNTLNESGVWTTFCGGDSYEQIKQFTGFDIHHWIESHVDWMADFSEEMKQTIEVNQLENYLIW